MADASDSKSDEGDFVRVQVPPSAFLGRGALYNEYEDIEGCLSTDLKLRDSLFLLHIVRRKRKM